MLLGFRVAVITQSAALIGFAAWAAWDYSQNIWLRLWLQDNGLLQLFQIAVIANILGPVTVLSAAFFRWAEIAGTKTRPASEASSPESLAGIQGAPEVSGGA